MNAVDAIIQASLDSLEERIIQLWAGCPLIQDSVIAVTEKVGDQTINDRYAIAATRVKATDEIITVDNRQDNLSKNGQPITWENESQILSIFEKYRNVLIDSIYVQKKLGNRVKQARDILQGYINLRKASEEDNWLDINDIWANNPRLHDLDHTQGEKKHDDSTCLDAVHRYFNAHILDCHCVDGILRFGYSSGHAVQGIR